MDNKIPKEYVTELLKQLEELKRKKAHKERKLQKLKGCSVKDLKNKRSKSTSHIFIRKEPEQINNNEVILENLNKSVSEKNVSTNETCDSLINLDCVKSNDTHLKKSNGEISVNDKLNLSFEKYDTKHFDVNILNAIAVTDQKSVKNHNVDRTTIESFEKVSPASVSFKHNQCKAFEDNFIALDVGDTTENNENFISKKFQLSLFKDKFNDDVENPAIENSTNENIIIPDKGIVNDRVTNVKEAYKNEKMPMNVELLSLPVPDFSKSFPGNNYLQNENKLPSAFDKSLPSSKSKNSDILDDSLNSNMSFFMSADLFANDFSDSDKKERIKNNDIKDDNRNTLIKSEYLSQVKKNSKAFNLNPKVSYINSHLSLNGSQQNQFGAFSFPKFSTPTEGNTQYDNDDNISDLVEQSQITLTCTSAKNVCLSAETNGACKNILSSVNRIDSASLSFVLEKRLSSILDAHYESPKKISSGDKLSSAIINDNQKFFNKDVTCGNVYKKRKLFTEDISVACSGVKLENQKLEAYINSDMKLNNVAHKSFTSLEVSEKEFDCDGFDIESVFNSNSDSFNTLKKSDHPASLMKDSCDDIPSQVTKTVDGLVTKVCEDASQCKSLIWESVNKDKRIYTEINEDLKIDSEILVIPETEGLELYFPKDTDEFLETSTLSESMSEFPVKENVLNMSSQSKLESPVVNNIVAAVKSSKSLQNKPLENKNNLDVEIKNSTFPVKSPEKDNEKVPNDTAPVFDNSVDIDTSFLEDDTQDLGNFKQVPYMNDVNVQERAAANKSKTDMESNLNFMCSLSGSINEPVMDVEIILFKNVKYAVIQHKTYICVWRQEKMKQWIKIFSHQIEEMLSLVKICVSIDENNLVIVMLLSNEEQYCLQFLIFEKDTRVIKLMENTHWLEERSSEDSVLLCGLSGLMFAVAQNKSNPEVSIHAFISLKENPRLMTAVLGSTKTPLCSLCRIDKLPNALMGISDSMLYVWHILEARLVTAVSLYPHDYIPIKECFWATVENGLIYFLTTCESENNHYICQLLAANLATGFCQSAMAYSTQPSNVKVDRITKAAYLEPFLVVSHSSGAFIWSVMEEFCCATLPSESNITTVAISKDFDNWGILAVGSKSGHINCYTVH